RAERVQKAYPGIPGNAHIAPELQRVRAFSPGDIIDEVVHRHLETVAVGDALIESQKGVERFIGVSRDTQALARESPAESICQAIAQNPRISDGESFAVVQDGLLRGSPWKERFLRIAQI